MCLECLVCLVVVPDDDGLGGADLRRWTFGGAAGCREREGKVGVCCVLIKD